MCRAGTCQAGTVPSGHLVPSGSTAKDVLHSAAKRGGEAALWLALLLKQSSSTERPTTSRWRAAGAHTHHARQTSWCAPTARAPWPLASFAVGGFQLEGYAMTLSASAWNIVTYTRYSFGCDRLGTTSNLVMYVSGRQRLRGSHRHLPRHALAGRLEHGAPGLLGAAGRNREAPLRESLSWKRTC